MATIKSYTDISQSKKLAEFLPIESADMFYRDNGIDVKLMWEHNAQKVTNPCWSLAALLGVLPLVDFTTPQLIGTPKTLYRCIYSDNLKSHAYDNAVDACYEMILKLYELNLL